MWGRGQAARAEIEPAHFPTSPLPHGFVGRTEGLGSRGLLVGGATFTFSLPTGL